MHIRLHHIWIGDSALQLGSIVPVVVSGHHTTITVAVSITHAAGVCWNCQGILTITRSILRILAIFTAHSILILVRTLSISTTIWIIDPMGPSSHLPIPSWIFLIRIHVVPWSWIIVIAVRIVYKWTIHAISAHSSVVHHGVHAIAELTVIVTHLHFDHLCPQISLWSNPKKASWCNNVILNDWSGFLVIFVFLGWTHTICLISWISVSDFRGKILVNNHNIRQDLPLHLRFITFCWWFISNSERFNHIFNAGSSLLWNMSWRCREILSYILVWR